jgi:basic membrane protein A
MRAAMRRLWMVLGGLAALNGLLLVLGAGRATPGAGEKRLVVGLVFDVGGLGDKSFNDSAHRGLMRAAADFDIETRMIEPREGADREAAMRDLANDGADLVIGVGFMFTDDIRLVAKQFPHVKFACIDYSLIPGQSPPPPNLVGLRFREHEGSFLVGALAALVSKTKKLGFVGGMEGPLIRKFETGYKAGVKHVCPECEVYAAYAGNSPEAFADPTRGKEYALAQYGRGADVIFHASGSTGLGVFNAAKAEGRFAIGVDKDQFHEAPCCVLTSMLKGVDVSVYDTIRAVVEGKFTGGVRELGLTEGGVDYVYDDNNRRWIPPETRVRVEELRRAIMSGEIRVPYE